MKKMNIRPVLLLIGLLLTGFASAEVEKRSMTDRGSSSVQTNQANDRQDHEIEIKVHNNGERVLIYVSFLVPVMPQQAWAVLTDFNNLSDFTTSIQSSRVSNKMGNTMHVSQRGVTQFGLLTYSIDTVGEVNLTPFSKIHERMISGNMQKMDETTMLIQEGDSTRITYYADIVPGLWILRFVGQFFIENEARKRFIQTRNEIIRRYSRESSPN
jgi:carbon monoxide dehydrogenase subunit G